ncbi:MAG: HYR domain-containing protein [Flavobacteriaceae bacterium]|nr:HYR domain-containing protein [Flavobacteriaceae bacterium]
MKKITLILLMFVFTCFTYGQTVTKTFTPPSSVSVDGCGTYCVTLPSVSFTAADFPLGGIITDVNVSISWLKTDGTCTLPTSGNSFHNETSFRVNGPVSQSILATPGTWSGSANSPAVTTIFDQASASIPSGTPVSGTFLPNGGDLNIFNCLSPIGIWSLSAGDTAGSDPLCVNSYSITITVAPADNIPPVADVTPLPDVTAECEVTTLTAPTATDNCAGALTGTHTATLPITAQGTTVIIWTYDDGNGNTSTQNQNVVIDDVTAPVITCIADDTRDTDAGVCDYTVQGTEFDATFTDNCMSSTITNDLNGTATIAGEALPIGDTTVVWIVDDGNGQTDTCTTVITVEDNEVPVIVCPMDVDISTDPGVCGAEVDFPIAVALDNCGGVTVVQTGGLPSNSFFPIGVSTVEFTATDDSGNSTVCSFTITISDNEPAMAVCQDITIQLDEFGNASIVAADIDGGSTDNCGVASISASQTDFDCNNVGDNNVILTVTDVNGNTSTCTAVVTVEDVTNPIAVCQNITVQLDANGMITILGNDVDGGSTDACGIASYDLDIDTFDCSNVGDNTVVLTVTDVNGNTSTCTAIVTVEDITSPELVCMDITVELDENGMATIVPADVIDILTDACGINTTAIDIFEFYCSDTGTPIDVQVFVEDVNGNLTTCYATVTVVDLLAPVLTCPADQTQDPGAGNLFWEVPDYWANGEATATDNCTDPVVITTQDPAAGTLLSDGTYTVTMTAEDEYGNVSTCDFELIIESQLGLEDQQDSASIILYPNPVSNIVYLSNPNSLELENISIYDLTGRLVNVTELETMGTEISIDVSKFANATYMVVIRGINGTLTKQLIVNNY